MFLSTNGSNRNIFWHDHTESWSSCSGFTCSFNIIQQNKLLVKICTNIIINNK
jgi:hypothetical protein